MKSRRGSALIEFAVALAVLTPVFIGGVQFFQAYLLAEEIQQAAIQAARSGAALAYDSANEFPPPAFERAVQDVVLKSPIPGLRREHIKVTMRFDGGRPSEVEVRISGYKVQVPGGAIALDGKPHALYPYQGHWSASR
jgi:hypothetical protein